MMKVVNGFDVTHGPQKGARAELDQKERAWTVWTTNGSVRTFKTLKSYVMFMTSGRG
ncbi:hypothetical protein [Lactococcus lactis]|uniref:hypothetical protein n=1 Tax=Lactococcus lactis TaxID=1358 RepID=UPI00223B5F05|nr:hypothetical protein [Lactococcus lactis]